MKYLRVVCVPNGEAPLWVREKWVGLDFPNSITSQKVVNIYIAGVLTKPRNILSAIIGYLLKKYDKKNVYLVNAIQAVSILSKASNDAANWWKENTPYLLKDNSVLCFEENELEFVEY
jgi:hypothetical protein